MVRITAAVGAALFALATAAPAAPAGTRPEHLPQVSAIGPVMSAPRVPFPSGTETSKHHYHHTPTPTPHHTPHPHHTPSKLPGHEGTRTAGEHHLPTNILPRWLLRRAEASTAPESNGHRGEKSPEASGKPLNPAFGQHHTPGHHTPHHTPTPTPHHRHSSAGAGGERPSKTLSGEGPKKTEGAPFPEISKFHTEKAPQ